MKIVEGYVCSNVIAYLHFELKVVARMSNIGFGNSSYISISTLSLKTKYFSKVNDAIFGKSNG